MRYEQRTKSKRFSRWGLWVHSKCACGVRSAWSVHCRFIESCNTAHYCQSFFRGIIQARILHNPHCMKRDPGRPCEPYKRSRNGLCRQGACQSLQIVNQARMRQSWTRTGRIDAGVSVPECVRPIPTRILPEAKKSRFLRGIESWHELDFTRRQTAKNGGFGAE